METILLENCVKQYKILLSSIKGYLQNMYNVDLSYDGIKNNLFTAIKMISTAEDLTKVYNLEDKQHRRENES